MKRYLWLLLAGCLTSFETWAVFTESGPMNFANHSILFPLILVSFAASGLGGCWMLFSVIRREKHVFPVVLVPFLIPNSFLWYYFERVMPKKPEQPDLPSQCAE